jgi:maltoporin
MGLAPARALAQEPGDPGTAQGTEADTHHNTEEPKQAEQPSPVVEPSAATGPAAAQAIAPAPATVPPPARPKVGDISVSGYLRGGFGAIIPQETGGMKVGGRMTCFSLSNPQGLVAKYRLGNECEVWSETHFTFVTYVGEDGVVSRLHFMPTIFIPTTNIGYSPTATVVSPAMYTTATGATVSFPNLYVDLSGVPWLGGGTAWIGTRYYKRESVYINDFFYWNPSGVGAGVEDINLGKDMRLSVAVFATDGQPQQSNAGTDPQLPAQIDFGFRNDVQLRGIKPTDTSEIQLGVQYIKDFSNHNITDYYGNTMSVTHSGWGVTGQFVQKLLGGDNKLAVQYGRGGGTGFGTLSRFYYPDFSLYLDPSEARFRALDVLTIQPTEWLGAQADVIYQYDWNFLNSPGLNTSWISAGARVSWAFADHAKLLGEIGYDNAKRGPADHEQLTKLTIAPTLTAGRGLFSRPELRLFYTWAMWNAAARGANIDSGSVYRSTNFLSGSTFGVQAETWY